MGTAVQETAILCLAYIREAPNVLCYLCDRVASLNYSQFESTKRQGLCSFLLVLPLVCTFTGKHNAQTPDPQW